MIYGIGNDLLDAGRIRDGLARFGDGYARRLLAESELVHFHAHANPARYLAKSFAAKEAFAKACGTGVRAPLTLTSLAVERDALGKPGFVFSPELSDWLAARGVGAHHLSLSDEGDMVLATVVLERARAGEPT